MTEADERLAVTNEARKWLGTPYHDGARVRGAGVDCAMIIAAVFEDAGLEAIGKIEPYSPQWYLHQGDEIYLNKVLERTREITEAESRPADLVLYKFGRCFAHGALIVEPGFPTIIHAFKQAGSVVIGDGTTGHLKDRPRRFFTRRAWGV